jgi:hypothetical protein
MNTLPNVSFLSVWCKDCGYKEEIGLYLLNRVGVPGEYLPEVRKQMISYLQNKSAFEEN